MNKNNFFKYTRYIIYTIIFSLFFVVYILVVNPILFNSDKKNLDFDIDSGELKKHVSFLVNLEEQRTYNNINALNKVGEYIYNHFEKVGCDKIEYQKFVIDDSEYKNVICLFNGENTEKIVLGAHYDVDAIYTFDKIKDSSKYKGADDNASGVAGILEISRLLGKDKGKLKNTIELVAYSLEEMPFFATEEMGSYIHAKSLFDKNEKIQYMISLEMIGFYSDEKIQKYPVRFLSRFYPSKGNFIALIGELFDNDIRKLKDDIQSYANIDVWSISAPKSITGVDFSDHRNYWELGYKAYMITDTSFYRNKNYHTINDTIYTLDFDKMREVVKGVYGAILK